MFASQCPTRPSKPSSSSCAAQRAKERQLTSALCTPNAVEATAELQP